MTVDEMTLCTENICLFITFNLSSNKMHAATLRITALRLTTIRIMALRIRIIRIATLKITTHK
jgi:hypothetical protein